MPDDEVLAGTAKALVAWLGRAEEAGHVAAIEIDDELARIVLEAYATEQRRLRLELIDAFGMDEGRSDGAHRPEAWGCTPSLLRRVDGGSAQAQALLALRQATTEVERYYRLAIALSSGRRLRALLEWQCAKDERWRARIADLDGRHLRVGGLRK